MAVALSCPVLAFALIIVLTVGRELCCSFFSSCIDALTQGSVRPDRRQKAIRRGVAGWLFGTLSFINIIHVRQPVPPSTILLRALMTVPEECYQHAGTPP